MVKRRMLADAFLQRAQKRRRVNKIGKKPVKTSRKLIAAVDPHPRRRYPG